MEDKVDIWNIFKFLLSDELSFKDSIEKTRKTFKNESFIEVFVSVKEKSSETKLDEATAGDDSKALEELEIHTDIFLWDDLKGDAGNLLEEIGNIIPIKKSEEIFKAGLRLIMSQEIRLIEIIKKVSIFCKSLQKIKEALEPNEYFEEDSAQIIVKFLVKDVEESYSSNDTYFNSGLSPTKILLEILEKSRDKYKSRIDSLEKSRDKYKSRIDSLKKSRDKYKSYAVSLEDQIAKTQAALSEQEKNHLIEVESLKKAILEEQSKYLDLKTRNKEYFNIITEDFYSKISNLEENINQKVAKISELKQDKKELKLKSREKEKNYLESLQNLEKINSSLSREVNLKVSQIDLLNDEIRKLLSSLNSLKDVKVIKDIFEKNNADLSLLLCSREKELQTLTQESNTREKELMTRISCLTGELNQIKTGIENKTIEKNIEELRKTVESDSEKNRILAQKELKIQKLLNEKKCKFSNYDELKEMNRILLGELKELRLKYSTSLLFNR